MKTDRSPLEMSRPEIDESDVAAVAEVVRSGRLALGPAAEAFERAIAERTGTRHAIAVSSGTAALHAVVRALGLGPGDEVLLPSFTFAASANALLYEGARPVFCEIDPETYNIDPADLERRVTPKTRAILVVDVFGHPAEWDAILDLAARQGLSVIDDACEALGATYRGRPLGSFGDAATFAFYPNKQITTGEGGMVVTDDDRLAREVRSLRNQGRGAMGAWLEHERLGYNYRLDEMSAALGLSQLRRLDAILDRRARVARLYDERLAGLSAIRTPSARPHVGVSPFVYVVAVAPDLDRDAVIRALERRGVPARAYFPPVHLQPYVVRRLGHRAGDLPTTEAIAARTLALPFHGALDEADVERVAVALEASLGEPDVRR